MKMMMSWMKNVCRLYENIEFERIYEFIWTHLGTLLKTQLLSFHYDNLPKLKLLHGVYLKFLETNVIG